MRNTETVFEDNLFFVLTKRGTDNAIMIRVNAKKIKGEISAYIPPPKIKYLPDIENILDIIPPPKAFITKKTDDVLNTVLASFAGTAMAHININTDICIII
jgi:hypothetical protein